MPFPKAILEAFTHSRREYTYPENSYTPNYTRVLRRSQGIVCTGEITLWCWATGISPLDGDALGWHFVNSSFDLVSRSVIEEAMSWFEGLEMKLFEARGTFLRFEALTKDT